MGNPQTEKSRWSGKSAEDVLAISLHELRNPIARLMGYLKLLQSSELSEEQYRKFVDLAFDCSQLAQDVVDNISLYLSEEQQA